MPLRGRLRLRCLRRSVARLVLALEELAQRGQQRVCLGLGRAVENVLHLVRVLVEVVQLVEAAVLREVVVVANVGKLGQQQVVCGSSRRRQVSLLDASQLTETRAPRNVAPRGARQVTAAMVLIAIFPTPPSLPPPPNSHLCRQSPGGHGRCCSKCPPCARSAQRRQGCSTQSAAPSATWCRWRWPLESKPRARIRVAALNRGNGRQQDKSQTCPRTQVEARRGQDLGVRGVDNLRGDRPAVHGLRTNRQHGE